jgi:hypothetical protein
MDLSINIPAENSPHMKIWLIDKTNRTLNDKVGKYSS